MRRLLFVLVTLALVLAVAPLPAAAASGWSITSFNSDLGIAADGSLHVVETIAVDFGGLQKHGIYRDIPVRYAYNDRYDRALELSGWSVRDGAGHGVQYQVSMKGADQEVRIGDPNRTVSGRQTYVIGYTVRGAFNSFSDHDELYWNATGNQWDIPIEAASAVIHAPAGAIQRVTCYEGESGSTTPCVSSSASGGASASFNTHGAMPPGQGLTVVAALAKGTVPDPKPILVARPKSVGEMFALDPLDLGAFGVVLGAGIAVLAWLYWHAGRDRAYRTAYYLNHDPATPDEVLPLGEHRPVVVEFGPPDNFRPAQLGLILDERADTRDVTASIVDLAARGYLTITEQPGQGLLGRADHVLKVASQAPPAADLQTFEKTLLDGLFAGRTEVALSTLKGTFRPTLDSAEAQLLQDGMARRWFTHDPRRARIGWRLAGILTMVAGLGLAIVLGQAVGAGLAGIALLLVGAALTLLAGEMPARTATGHDLLYRTLGFRLYMTTAERYQQQFAEREQIFTRLLPYAIVFGCVDRWVHAFQDIDVQAAVAGWYTGAVAFNALAFSNSLQGFASSVNTSMAAVPASTGGSGFSGGGFSGGGFGGGGGGSW